MPMSPKIFGQKERRRDTDKRRGTKRERGYGGVWEKLSLMKRADCPVCQVCNNAAATQVDHIIPFEGEDDPLRLEWTNLQSICQQCHSWKTNVGKNTVAKVVVVCGDPGAGKTTFCERHKPSEAALFDLDEIAAAMNPEWRQNKFRGVEVNALLGEWREVLVSRIAGSKFLKETWIILSDKDKAGQTAIKLSGRLVICQRDGSKFTSQIQDRVWRAR